MVYKNHNYTLYLMHSRYVSLLHLEVSIYFTSFILHDICINVILDLIIKIYLE